MYFCRFALSFAFNKGQKYIKKMYCEYLQCIILYLIKGGVASMTRYIAPNTP